jgi:hypothetical protein
MPGFLSANPLPAKLGANACWFTTMGIETNNKTTVAIVMPNVIVVLYV